MNPADFTLRPANEPNPTLLDEDPVTPNWPTPVPRDYSWSFDQPGRRATVRERLMAIFFGVYPA